MVVAEEDFTAAVEGDFIVAEVFMAAEVTMATVADIPTASPMAVSTTVDAVVMVGLGATEGMAATTVVMAGTVATAGVAATDGAADFGAFHATDGAGDGILDLALGGRTGVGDTRTATTDTALGITLPTLTTTRIIVLRDTHVLPTGTMILRLRIPDQNPGATQQCLGDHR